MPNPADYALISDARPLYTATRTLLGYRLSLRFQEVLTGLLRHIRDWWKVGLLGKNGRPVEQFQRVCLDFNVIDPEPLWDLCGTFFYILASHKSANYRMMHPAPHPHVLYLRGFDYDAAVGVTDDVAMGVQTVDDVRFLANLKRTLAGHATLFKVMSPTDLELETLGMEQRFRGDYQRIIEAASARTLSFYLNAQCWKDDVAFLAQRVDALVVYVSSISESARWELEHLVSCGLNDRTTVVFDREAIRIKAMQSGFHEKMPQVAAGDVLWRPTAMHGTEADIHALYDWLIRHFTVLDAKSFDQHADELAARIEANGHDRSAAASQSYLPLRFHPAADPPMLSALRRHDAALWDEIDPERGGEIDCLPFHLNQVQLRIVTAMLLGNLIEAGRTLAVFAGCMGGAYDYYTTAGQIVEGLSQEAYEGYIGGLAEMHDRLLEIAREFLAYGSETDFTRNVTEAIRVSEPIEAVARQRVRNLLEPTAREGGITIVLSE